MCEDHGFVWCRVWDPLLWLHVIVCFVTVDCVVEKAGRKLPGDVCVCSRVSSSEIHVPFFTDHFVFLCFC